MVAKQYLPKISVSMLKQDSKSPKLVYVPENIPEPKMEPVESITEKINRHFLAKTIWHCLLLADHSFSRGLEMIMRSKSKHF